MKLLFLFMRYSSDPVIRAFQNVKTNAYQGFKGSCYLKLIEELVNNKNSNIDEATILIEDGEKYGIADWVDNSKIRCAVIPHIESASRFVDDQTIIFARGGFKQWHEWLMKYKGKNWIMLYAANTGMSRWPQWDIVLDDIEMKNYLDKEGRLFLPFIKPVNEEEFFPIKNDKPMYDLCVGASHIHDKKGQWRARKVFYKYRELYGKSLNIIMPGSPRRSKETIEMLSDEEYITSIDIPGYVTKKELVTIFNDSKFFLHLGTHGQNDRGPLEAVASGLPVLIGSPNYHTSLLKKINQFTVGTSVDNYEAIARQINYLLTNHRVNIKEHIYNYYMKFLSMKESVINMTMTFRAIERMGKPTISAKEGIDRFFKYIYR